MTQDDRRYFLVKHDLESLLALPHYIWRTGKDTNDVPHRFDEIRIGDRWVSLAFIDNERDRRMTRKILGFSECIQTKWHGPIPPQALAISNGATDAWFIRGEPFETQPLAPVDVPRISQILERHPYTKQAVTPITAEEFERLRQSAFSPT